MLLNMYTLSNTLKVMKARQDLYMIPKYDRETVKSNLSEERKVI